MKKRNISVTLECFVKKGNKYLMLHRKQNKRILPDVWMAPGGHREFNEGLFACAKREILEETGLTIKNIRIKAHGNAYLKDLAEEFYFHLLVADYASGTVRKNLEDGELVWLNQKQILSLDHLLAELKFVLPFVFSEGHAEVSYCAVYEKGNFMSEFAVERPE